MKKNVSRFEAFCRLALGSALFYLFIIGGPIWSLFGLYLMFTGSFRFCPLYYWLAFR